MRAEPTIEEKIASLACEGEVDGATGQIVREAGMTPRIKSLLEMKRAQLRKERGK